MSRRWYIYGPIALALLALLVWRTLAWEALEVVGRANAALIVLAVALDGLVIAGWTVRSRRLLLALGHPLSLRDLVPIVVFANTVAAVTPASLGEALRAMVLRRRHGIPYRVGAALILVERLVSFYLLAAWTGVALAALALPATLRLPFVIVAGGAVAFVPSAVARSPAGLAGLLHRVGELVPVGQTRLRRIAAAAADAEDLARGVVSSGTEMARFTLVTAVVLGAGAAQVVAVAAAFDQGVDPLVAWAALGSGQVAGIISALPFGLGAAESVMAIGLVAGGLAPALATVITLSVRLLTNVPIALCGVASYLYVAADRDPSEPITS